MTIELNKADVYINLGNVMLEYSMQEKKNIHYEKCQ